MAFRVVSAPGKNVHTPVINESANSPSYRAAEAAEPSRMEHQQSHPESSIFGRLGVSALKGVESPVRLIDTISQLFGNEALVNNESYPSQRLTSHLGYSPEQLEPQGLIERYAQKLAQQTPTAALFGPGAIAANALSAIPASLAGHAGAPESLQDLLQLGTDIGGGIARGKFKAPSIAREQGAAYNAALRTLPEKARPLATAVEHGLESSLSKIKTQTDSRITDKVKNIVDTVRGNLHTFFEGPGKTSARLDPKEALALRKSIYRQVGKDKNLIEYTKPITDSINKFFTEYSIENPEFFKHLSKADRLTQAKNMYSYLEDVVERIPAAGSIGKFGKGLTKFAVSKTFGGAEKFARKIATSSEARKVYGDFIKGVASNNPTTILNNFNNLVEVFTGGRPTSQEPEKQLSGKGNFKVVSGGVAKMAPREATMKEKREAQPALGGGVYRLPF